MPDTLKVKLLTGRSGEDGSYSPGDSVELPIKEALALIDSEQAIASNKKAYEAAIAGIEAQKTADAEREAQRTAVLEKETLTAELRDLYAQVARKVAQIEGVILSDEEVEAFVEKSMKGEDPANDNVNFPAGKSDDENGSGAGAAADDAGKPNENETDANAGDAVAPDKNKSDAGTEG